MLKLLIIIDKILIIIDKQPYFSENHLINKSPIRTKPTWVKYTNEVPQAAVQVLQEDSTILIIPTETEAEVVEEEERILILINYKV